MSDSNVTLEALQAELARMQAENAELKEAAKTKRKAPPFSVKMGKKGNVSVYGLQRFPVTLYANQWERLLSNSDKIREFIVQNVEHLTIKE